MQVNGVLMIRIMLAQVADSLEFAYEVLEKTRLEHGSDSFGDRATRAEDFKKNGIDCRIMG